MRATGDSAKPGQSEPPPAGFRLDYAVHSLTHALEHGLIDAIPDGMMVPPDARTAA
ncbi:MAG: hypothetical protein ABSC06_01880 [Rhodopila sp.]|jgi:hypothetical protein